MKKPPAFRKAQRFAKEGPRVASVICKENEQYEALAGYVDSDLNLPSGVRTVCLVTPDGRFWYPKEI